MIPFGLASDQGDGLIWASVACTAVALVLLAVGLRRQARSGKLASVPPWALPAEESPAAPSAADTAIVEAAPASSTAAAGARASGPAKRVGVRATGTRTKKAAGAKKAGAKKAAGTKKATAKKASGRRAPTKKA